MKVVYITGKGRSGSTLLDTALGQVDGFFSTGELWNLWDWGLVAGHRCGCGRSVPTCEVWSDIVDDASSVLEMPLAARARELVRLRDEVMAWRRVPRLLRQTPSSRSRWPALERYARVLAELYASIGRVTGARVIVDSSKFPAHPGLLGLVPGIEPYLVQLVRDPRAVTHSYRRLKMWPDREPAEPMPQFGPTYSTTSWLARNLTAEVVRSRLPAPRSVRLDYESFVRRPRAALDGIVERTDEHGGGLELDERRSVVLLRTTHTIGGNPDRFRTGAVELREDGEWRSSIGVRDRLVTTALAAPLLHRYGYPLHGAPPEGAAREEAASTPLRG